MPCSGLLVGSGGALTVLVRVVVVGWVITLRMQPTTDWGCYATVSEGSEECRNACLKP